MLAVSPNNYIWKIQFGTQRIEVLQKTYAERCLSRPCRSAYNTGKRMFKPDFVNNGCPLLILTLRIYTRMEGMCNRSSAFALKKILYEFCLRVC